MTLRNVKGVVPTKGEEGPAANGKMPARRDFC